jgi:peptidoglycan/LPS O-acetylase OafA/YrhL
MPDFTGKDAGNRVLYVNFLFFKYGTNDKAHAAALILSTVLLAAIIGLVFFGTRHNNAAWDDKAFSWLSGAFLFIAGVALGKGGAERRRHDEMED